MFVTLPFINYYEYITTLFEQSTHPVGCQKAKLCMNKQYWYLSTYLYLERNNLKKLIKPHPVCAYINKVTAFQHFFADASKL